MNDATLGGEATTRHAVTSGAEEPPILFLHGIDRHYRQGDETVHVLNGVELALWGGQSVALVAPSGEARLAISERSNTRRACTAEGTPGSTRVLSWASWLNQSSSGGLDWSSPGPRGLVRWQACWA